MAFSIAFKIPISTVTFETIVPNADAITGGIAREAASAAWAIVAPTWLTAGLTLAALIAAGVSVYYSYQALKTWRHQVIGEHEFGRILEAIQSIFHLKRHVISFRTIQMPRDGMRSGQESEIFRREGYKHIKSLISSTVGLDSIWDKDFIKARSKLELIAQAISDSSYQVYETNVIDGIRDFLPYVLKEIDFGSEGKINVSLEYKAIGDEFDLAVERLESILIEKLKKYTLK